MAGKRREKGTGSVYPRKNAKGEITSYGVSLGDSYQTVTTEAEGKALLVRWQHEANQGIVRVEPVNRTVSDLCAEYLSEVVGPSLRHATFVRIEREIRLHVRPQLGAIKLANLSTLDVQKFLNYLAIPLPKGRGMRSSTISVIRGLLITIFNQGIDWGWLPEGRNPAKKARVPGNATPPKTVPKFTAGQAAALHKAFSESPYRDLLITSLALGLRPGEVRGITRDCITFDPATGTPIRLEIRHQLQWEKREGDEIGKPCLVPPKTRQSNRHMNLGAIAADALMSAMEHAGTAWQRCILEGRLTPAGQWAMEQKLVFVTSKGTPVLPAMENRAFHKCIKDAGMDGMTPHKLRALWATGQIDSGMASELEVLRAGGWSKGDTMRRHYAQSTEAGQARVAAASDAMFQEPGG